MAVAIDLPFRQAAGVIEGVGDWVHNHHAAWRLLPLQPGFETRLVELAASGGLDAAIGTFVSDSWLAALTAHGVYAVNVFDMSHITSVPCVGCDEEEIGSVAARHLVGQGVRELGFLGSGGLLSTRLRSEGFKKTAGSSRPVRVLHPGSLLEADLSAFQHFPAGLFCASDALALEAVSAARCLGLEPGADLLVVGVGDDPAASIFAGIALSTFELPASTIGYRAAALLAGLLDTAGEGSCSACHDVPSERLPAKLLVRASSLASRHAQLAHRARDTIAARYSEPSFDATRLAEICGVSKRLLETTLRRQLDTSPARLIATHRLETACRLLAHTSLPIHQIAARCGFITQHHFSAWFKKRIGMPPKTFRNQPD